MSKRKRRSKRDDDLFLHGSFADIATDLFYAGAVGFALWLAFKALANPQSPAP